MLPSLPILDDYQIPATALISAMMPAFAYLHLRFRSVRTRLWLLAMICVEIHALLFWRVSNSQNAMLPWAFGGGLAPASPWMTIASESALMFSSALFLASLSPLSFKLGRFQVMYVVPYTIPLVLYSFLYYGISRHPVGLLFWVYVFLGVWATAAGLVWSVQKGRIPIWLTALLVCAAGGISVPFFLHGDVYWPLMIVQSGNMAMTALLVIYTFRRLTPGVTLATIGFLAWSLPPFFGTGDVSSVDFTEIYTVRAMILGKVAVAVGLILLVLESEIAKNQAARQRERRVRLELEAYSRQLLTARNLEEFDRESGKLCATIAEHSRFSKAALVVRTPRGNFNLVGAAGMDGATVGALDALIQRVDQGLNLCAASPDTPKLAPDSYSFNLDLTPWLAPGDDLERLHLTRVGAIPMLGPDQSLEGAVLLTGLRDPQEKLRADDLMPVETLTGRLQSARSQALMLGKLIDSERFAGVGQLATNVAHQLNNPLTVILGYAQLLEEGAASAHEQRAADAILTEARRMKGLLERISLFTRRTSERRITYSIADLMADMEQLHRVDFLRYAIDFRIFFSPDLPELVGNAHQIRQALMHAMQFAIESVIHLGPEEQRFVRLEATAQNGQLKILVGHSGRHFPNPQRVFDTLTSGLLSADAAGIGLSLCATIIRDHRGSITAENLEPTGATITLYLPIN